MNKEFVPYEQALSLKELGFEEPCFGCYTKNKELIIRVGDYRSFSNNNVENFFIDFNGYENGTISAPLYQQCFRWFREKYNIQCYWYNNNGKHLKYWIVIQVNSTKPIEFSTKSSIPELECLKKLIEIVKEK